MTKREMPDLFSPRKETKKARKEIVDELNVEDVVNSVVFTDMLKDKSHILDGLGEFISELLGKLLLRRTKRPY